MKLKFLGAAGTVTGSSYVLTSGSGESILIDLGMFQGPPKIEKMNYLPFEYDCSQLIGAVLTHAHLDHCGRLPIMIPMGFKADIWMTPATQELTELSLIDSAKIAKQDEKEILYDADLALATFSHFRSTEYRTPFRIGPFSITFRDAGHILGSASLEIEDSRADSEIRKIVFSGDLGNAPEDLVEKTEYIENADSVIIESTYGDRLHPDLDPMIALQNEINTIEQTNGTLLIPAFSLEKTQELLHMIMHLKSDGKVQGRTPVYMDSPMATKATEIYMAYPEYMNTHAREDMKRGNLFNFSGLNVTRSRRDSKSIYHQKDAKIIIAGSGMMSGGRIVGHAANFLSRSTTRLFIVGYQGEETLGRELAEGKKEVMIDGNLVHVNATVTQTQAMSSHADQGQLMDWLKQIQGVKKVYITHGEDEPRKVFAHRIEEELSIHDIFMPTLNQEITL